MLFTKYWNKPVLIHSSPAFITLHLINTIIQLI